MDTELKVDSLLMDWDESTDIDKTLTLSDVPDLDDVLASTSQIIPEIKKEPPNPTALLKTYTLNQKLTKNSMAIASTTTTVSTITAATATTSATSSTPSTSTTLPATVATKLTTTATTPAANQKIVIIQNSGGAPQPIRLANSPALSPNSIQFIKTSDGSFVQIKNKLTSSGSTTATTTPVGQQPVQGSGTGALGGRFIVKTGAGQRLILATPPTVKMIGSANATTTTTPTATSSSTIAVTSSTPTISTATNAIRAVTNPNSNTRTLTVAQAQRMGLLSTAKLKELVTAANAQKQAAAAAAITASTAATTKTATSSSTNVTSTANNASPSTNSLPTRPFTTTSTKTSTMITSANSSSSAGGPTQKQKLPTNPSQKIVIQTANGVQRQVVLPPHLYKLAQQGQIKAVSIAGKGIQYVRVNPAKTADSKQVTRVVSSGTSGNQPFKTYVQKCTADGQIVMNKSTFGETAQNSTFGKLPTLADKQLIPAFNMITTTRLIKQEPQTTPPVVVHNFKQRPAKAGQIVIEKSSSSDSDNHFSGIVKIEPINEGQSASNNNAPTAALSFGSTSKKYSFSNEDSGSNKGNDSSVEIEALRRKHCNCTKSQCLKLYCDCFANGEFCSNCNCKECYNNLENEEERQKAIKMCLERNPHAFKPKIGKIKDQTDTLRRHTKGCNCKRSGCLKNYCECYEAKIVCSENCKCVDCRNMEEFDRRLSISGDQMISISNITSAPQHMKSQTEQQEQRHLTPSLSTSPQQDVEMESATPYEKPTASTSMATSTHGKHERDDTSAVAAKKPCNFMTQDVIEATIQCVVAQADECQKNNMDTRTAERMIIEEFGRCLVEIIEFSVKNSDN